MNRRAVVVSCAVGHHAVVSEAGVWHALKTVRDHFFPVTADIFEHFENGSATAAGSTFTGGAVKRALAVDDKVADRAVAVPASLKTVENSLAPLTSGAR